jgi:high-affinity iron transporter
MGIAFLKMDHSRIKWRYKLAAAFEDSSKRMIGVDGQDESIPLDSKDKRESRSSRWALFLLPLITLLREGLEAVVFVGGVSMNLPATSIPLPVVIGLIAGAIIGYIIYRTGSSTTLHWFLIASTTILFLIGAGLFSRGIGFFQYYRFAHGVGGDVAETGDGTGSFQVAGNVWHLEYGNPETGAVTTNGGWQIFNAILGWNNTATLGSILSYVFYWIAVVATLVYLKWKEGRVSFCGFSSAAAKRREVYRANREADANAAVNEKKAALDGDYAPSSSSGQSPSAEEVKTTPAGVPTI